MTFISLLYHAQSQSYSTIFKTFLCRLLNHYHQPFYLMYAQWVSTTQPHFILILPQNSNRFIFILFANFVTVFKTSSLFIFSLYDIFILLVFSLYVRKQFKIHSHIGELILHSDSTLFFDANKISCFLKNLVSL